MDNRTCAVCGTERPLTREHYRWRVQDGKGYFTGECVDCIAKAKKQARLRARARRKAGLDRIEAAGVDIFIGSTVRGGSNIPHTAEVVERVFGYFGGVGGFSAVLVKQYFDAPPGGSARTRLLETMCRLVTKNVETGGAKRPLQLWSEEELEQELNRRLSEAVASFQGVTIDGETQEVRLIGQAEAAPASAAPADAKRGRHDAVPEGFAEGNPERTT